MDTEESTEEARWLAAAMLEFDVPPPSEPAERLRAEVRAFVAAERAAGTFAPRSNSWLRYCPEFSRRCGERGYVGMTWPKRYGGAERSERERWVVAEEMLAAGAPVGAHWIADRQSGTQILRFGQDSLKAAILPRIAAGQCYFAIGMSEPDSGSDLSSVRTRAERADGGWRLHGRKVWTTNAHLAHYLIALVRVGTAEERGADKRAGLTQVVVDLSAPGIEINPILNMSGEREFNEVVLDGCFVPDDHVLGAVGDGWKGVTNELALERSGPDRFLTLMPLIELMFDHARVSGDANARVQMGRVLAHLLTLRHMSGAVAAMAEAGIQPNTQAAAVKDLGTSFEQEVPEIVRRLSDVTPSLDAAPASLAERLAQAVMEAPSFSLRGGTREVLRGIIARELGLR